MFNPYFELYEEPLYQTTVGITPIPKTDWSKVITAISSKAAYVSKLLMNEMPDNMEDAFSDLALSPLPRSRKDFQTDCSRQGCQRGDRKTDQNEYPQCSDRNTGERAGECRHAIRRIDHSGRRIGAACTRDPSRCRRLGFDYG